ncbi:hypothetical protein TcasGA2_TC031011, partial [Tribolium castaneum]
TAEVNGFKPKGGDVDDEDSGNTQAQTPSQEKKRRRRQRKSYSKARFGNEPRKISEKLEGRYRDIVYPDDHQEGYDIHHDSRQCDNMNMKKDMEEIPF